MKKWLLAAMLFPAVAMASPSGLRVTHPWFRYLLPQVPAGGFMVLKNDTAAPIILTGTQSPACGMAMLHESVNKSGMDMMTAIKSVTVPAHGIFRFAPGGYHVMCMKPKMAVGKPVPVTLSFQNHPPMTVFFMVEGPNGPASAQ